MILLLVAHGAPGQIQAGEKDHFACWASGPLSKGDHKWGEKKDEFVIDQRDLGDVARFNMKLRPELLEDPHNREKSGLFTAERLEGLSVAEQIEFTESLEVYTLFDSVPELVDYAFALDVFDAALCPRELDPLERDYLRLNPLENPLRVDLRPFPPRGCPFGATDVMRASMGDAGVFLRHSRRGREVRPTPAVLGWWVVDGAITLYDGSKRPGEEEVIQGGVVAGARFRIPVQNPAGARGSGLVGRDLLALRPSGWSTGFLS